MERSPDRAPRVWLRHVEDADLGVFLTQESDPESAAMAGFPPRAPDRFLAHWAKVRADDSCLVRTIVADGSVAGNIGSWSDQGQQLVGYWVGREWWGRGVATRALALMLEEVTARPVHAHVVAHNLGSIRVLEKCGFRRVEDHVAPEPDDGLEELLFVLD